MIEYPHIETTIPIDPRILVRIKLRDGEMIISSNNKEAYRELRKTLEEVIKSIDNVLKEYL